MMITHLTIEDSFGMSSKELARKVGDLRYDELESFFRALSQKFHDDSLADWDRNRTKLSGRLATICSELHNVANHASAAWRICEPHMK